MARNTTVTLAMAAGLAAAFFVIPTGAWAQADDYDYEAAYDAEYDAEYGAYDDSALAEDEVALAEDDAYGDLAQRWRGRGSPYGYRRFDRPYRQRYYGDYYYGSPRRYRYAPYRYAPYRYRYAPYRYPYAPSPYGYNDRGGFFFGLGLSEGGTGEGEFVEYARDDVYGRPRGWSMRRNTPYRYYDRDDYIYGRPRRDDYYRGRSFDKDDSGRWRSWRGEGRDFGRDDFDRDGFGRYGFAPEWRSREFGRERSESFGRPRDFGRREFEEMDRGDRGRDFGSRNRFEGRGGEVNRGFQPGSATIRQEVPRGQYATEEQTYQAPDEGRDTSDQPGGRSEDTGASRTYGDSNWRQQPWKSESRAGTTPR